MRVRSKKLTVLLATAGVIAGGLLAVAAPAQAWTGTQPGHMSWNPSSGAGDVEPTWTSDTPCPAPFNDGGQAVILDASGTMIDALGVTNPNVKTAPFSEPLGSTMGFLLQIEPISVNTWYEFAVACEDTSLNRSFVQSDWFRFTDAAGDWETSQTAPVVAGATPTTTTLSAPGTAAPGDPVQLNATVSPNNAVGAVEFFDGSTSLGAPVPVSSGAASLTVSTLAAGSHSLTAKFEPTDATQFAASTSPASPITIGSGLQSGSETINVNVPLVEGAFTMTVSNTPVDLGTATDNGNGQLEATGNLSPITVNDGRNVTKPGWNVSTQVSDFTAGANIIDGDDLGLSPTVVSSDDPAVTAGTPVAPGSHPGLKEGAGLAKAAAGQGLGQSVLAGGLDLQVPKPVQPGSYSATLTVTGMDTAS